jgi:L-threonylcarbamoyladenylate synthase
MSRTSIEVCRIVNGTSVYSMNMPEAVESGLKAAALALQRGELVGFPTETVYGLGANALDAQAVKRIFQAKGRPADNPLIVHVASLDDLEPLITSIPPRLPELAARFWPGPLTVIMPRSSLVPDVTSAGLPTVAIRIPNHSVTLALLRQVGLPVAGPSANRSGRPSPTTAAHVLADLSGAVAVLLDAGPSPIGVESTVLDLTVPVPTVLRPGGVSVEELMDVLGPVQLHPAATAALSKTEAGTGIEAVKSPGMKYTHYAPLAPLFLIEEEDGGGEGEYGSEGEGAREDGDKGVGGGNPARIWEVMYRWIESRSDELSRSDESGRSEESGRSVRLVNSGRTGLLISREGYEWFAKAGISENAQLFFFIMGTRKCLDTFARNLFTGLRSMDEAGVSVILAEGIPARGVGLAVMNRLRRAAGGNIIIAGGKQEHLPLCNQEG